MLQPLPSSEPSVPAPQAGMRREVSLFLGGDVMTGRGIDQILPHPGDPTLHEFWVKDARHYVELAEAASGAIPRNGGFSYIWGEALEVLESRQPDLRIVNLETAVTTSDAFWPGKSVHYRMHPRNLPCLSTAGLDCCVLANNHVLDWGGGGLRESLESLEQAGLAYAGAGLSPTAAARPAIFPLPGGRRVLVFSMAARDSGIPERWEATAERPGIAVLFDFSQSSLERIAAAVQRQRRESDLVVASIHWGGNWGYPVHPAHRRFAHGLIDLAGIDVIHGHSSHHPRGIEIYQGKPIFYGCGDLLNDYEGIPGHEACRPDLRMMAFVSMTFPGRRLAGCELVPMRIVRFSLERAPKDDAAWLHEMITRECRILGSQARSRGENRLFLEPV